MDAQNFVAPCKRLHKGTCRGCTCLKCTNKLEARARSAPTEFTAHSALLRVYQNYRIVMNG